MSGGEEVIVGFSIRAVSASARMLQPASARHAKVGVKTRIGNLRFMLVLRTAGGTSESLAEQAVR